MQKKISAPSGPVKSTRPVRKHEYEDIDIDLNLSQLNNCKHEYEDIDKDLNLSQLNNVEIRTIGLHSNGVGPSTGASSNRYVVGCY